ncbi:hypothetical protein O3Q51_01090 [Cryomorphaceae bacterium 1068]|nr:hypothetical protein [Cryomorphaceae bacterium 1068]
MKKLFLLAFVFAAIVAEAQQVEYKVVTSIESIIPAGIGRSRIISEEDELNYEDFTTERTDGKKSKQGDVSRGDAKIAKFEETKLLNFFSIAGINFQNIASNDALITDKINKMVAQGWELAFVVSGVESDAGKGDGQGIFITRYIFKRTI